MSGKSTVDQIRHYQKDIEKCPDNSERMIRCIQRLYILPIKVEHLQETGIGRSVNSLRKYKGEVGDAAKALVAKWKAMVAAEESNEDVNSQRKSQDVKSTSPSPPPKSDRKVDHEKSNGKLEQKDINSSKNKHHRDDRSHSLKASNLNESSRSKSHHESDDKRSSSSSRIKSSSSSSSKISEKHENSSKNHHSDKKRKAEEKNPRPEKKHKSHHSHKSSHSSKRKEKESEEEDSSSDESHHRDDSSDRHDSSGAESPVESNASPPESDSDSDFSSKETPKSRKHSSSHHKKSSHSQEKHKTHIIKKEKKEKAKEKELNKENHNKSPESSSSKGKTYSPDYNELIKENEKKIKKEKDNFALPKKVSNKNVKIEANEDGSIDSGSGASFADALLGVDSYSSKKKSKKSSSSSTKTSPSKNSSCSSSSRDEKSSIKALSSPSSSRPRTIEELVEPPDLLKKKMKLEPLELDISSTLPQINPNYKPLPHVPERLKAVKHVSDEDHMFHLMTQKNQRTKVFSGNKVNLTSVPSLFSLCIQLLYENIEAVEYTGGVPYQLLKPLLEKLNADQLYILEHFNPYLIEDTDELWKFHCSKEFRTEKRQDLESWRELYVRCMDERERKLKALTANISQSMAKSTPVRQAKLAYVDTVVKPPRNVARKQAKFGTAHAVQTSKNPTKQEIVNKAIVGGNTPGVSVKDTVPTPPPVARAAAHHPTPAIMKKKKAPLMQKALQVMKGTRYKR